MLPVIDLIFMALFFVGLLVYVAWNQSPQHRTARKDSAAARKGTVAAEPRGLPADAADVDVHPRRVPRSPAELAPLAAGINLLAPGLGHFLIGARMRGMLWLFGWLILVVLSGALHSPVVFILMIAAAVDAYLLGRSSDSRRHNASA